MNVISNNNTRPAPRPHQQPSKQTNKEKERCWRCGGIFSSGHKNQCAHKEAVCSICKKAGHFARMCRSKMPPLPIRKTNPRGPYQRLQGQGSQLRVRQIQENLLEEQEEQDDQNEIESVDPESALCIKKLSEDWADVNHIAPSSFKEVKNFNIILSQPKKYGWKQQQQRNLKIQWLADTGSPRSFITRAKQTKS